MVKKLYNAVCFVKQPEKFNAANKKVLFSRQRKNISTSLIESLNNLFFRSKQLSVENFFSLDGEKNLSFLRWNFMQ